MTTMGGVKSVNIFTELDRLKVKWTAAGEHEIRFCCPVHDDTTPSASLNTVEHVWKCYVPNCGASGDFVSLLAYFLKTERRVVLADLQTRYPDLAGVSEIPSQTVEKFHAALAQAGPLLKELEKRGVTSSMMREARLGFHDGRITIPIFDSAGRCVNIRRYLPGAPGPQKMRNTPGHGAPELYRVEQLVSGDSVMVCGGEMKALVAGTLLKDYAISVVSSTGGEGHWKDEWSVLMRGRTVYVCMDVDEAGVSAARQLAIALYGHAKTVRVVRLPLDRAQFPKGDVNDWVGVLGATGEQIKKLIDATPNWTPPQKSVISTSREAKQLDLDKAISNSTVGELIEVKAIIAAADQTPFLVPKELDIECSRDQPGCIVCPVRLEKSDEAGWVRMTIESGSSAVLGIVGSAEREQTLRISDALGIPPCKVVKFHVRTHHIVHDVRLSPPIDLAGGRVGDAWYPAMMISSAQTELNVPCRMRGSVYPHPKTQQAVALITEHEELEDTLSTYDPSMDDIRAMAALKPEVDTEAALNRKLKSIYDDIETNVTWIFRRRDMHLACDLTWHSPLLFNFGGRVVNGWVNLLVIGDSAQGKSECASRLMAHYGCGDRVDCKNATVAGLLGGLEQLGNRWFVRWGAIPARDRTLIILEELKGASTEVLSKLTDMRSSGIAEIPKIERRRACARTRIIMISNPRSPRPMDSFHFGVEAVHELIGSLEDVRRFDLAIAVAKGEVPDEVINSMPSSRPKVDHFVTAAVSKSLILWAWTRKPDQILIDTETTDTVVGAATALCKKYSESVPLVDQGTIRLKVARLACALAARVFSSPDGVNLLVTKLHVEFVTKFLDRIYSSKAMGYADFSTAQHLMSKIQDPPVIVKTIRGTKFPMDLASVMLRRDTISLEDIMSASAMDADGGRQILSLLVRKGALLRTGRSEYSKNPEFIALLKAIQSDTDPTEQHDTAGDDF